MNAASASGLEIGLALAHFLSVQVHLVWMDPRIAFFTCPVVTIRDLNLRRPVLYPTKILTLPQLNDPTPQKPPLVISGKKTTAGIDLQTQRPEVGTHRGRE